MAETPIISINTGEAVRNVKELKDNIAALKKQLDDASTSTDDYADIVSQLSQNQAALRNVMNGTHSSFDTSIKDAQGLSTSYNSLVQQLKTATQEWRAIPKYLTDSDKAQGIINQAWTDVANRVNTLRTELKGMDSDTGSYVRNVGNYKSALDGFTGSMGQIQQVGGDMVNGISAAASSMAMLGIESEGLSKSMNNLRIITAAVQGAKGFAGLIKQVGSYFKAGKQAVQVTNQQAAATKAQAAAQTAANVATDAGTVSMGLLQKALIATGIGALVVALGMLVAHFEDIVKWVGKVGEKFGLWKQDTYDVTQENEKLNKAIDKQNHALDNEQKVLAAQGVSNAKLLQQKKELVQQQIRDTQATIANVKARIEQLKADDRWWKFWQGTKGKIKEANEELKELEETLENLNQIETDIDVDIKVEGIKEGQKNAEAAAKKAAQDAAELAKKTQEIIKAGTDAATSAIRTTETETQKLDREFEENVGKINAAVAKMKELSGATADVAALESGLTALKTTYYRNRFEANAAEESKKIADEKEREYESVARYEKIYQGIFGMDRARIGALSKASAAEEKNYEILKAEVEYLKEQFTVPDDILPTLSGLSYEDLQKEFGEPTATALKMYFQKSKELESAGLDMYEAIFRGYEEAFNSKLSEGDYWGARDIAGNFSDSIYKEMKGKGYWKEILDYYFDTFEKGLEQYEADSETPGFIYLYNLFPQDEIDTLKIRVEKAQDIVKTAYEELKKLGVEYKASEGFSPIGKTQEQIDAMDRFWEAEVNLDRLEEELFKKRIGRFSSANAQIAKYFNTYGNATTNLMDNVADAWEAALQAQVKNGKKSEEQAKKSFGFIKALQLSSAVINTAGAVVQALADTTVPSYYVKAANAAAALAAGTAQVIKISQTEFSSNAASSTNSAPQLVDRTPQLQYTIGLNSQEYAQAQAQNPVRAYVVDRDLSEGLDEYNRKRGETTF